ncbi:MAG: O-antigen ligase family protein [Gammaproteobacteria bacterium]|nr:O-antigen ligase family protein [Gammaproteobacteria bacterium]
MLIRKRSFFEIIFPLTVVFFVCAGTQFIDEAGGYSLRWFLLAVLALYLLLNKKLLAYVYPLGRALLLTYLAWCITTTLWSEMPSLSFSKSVVFAANIIIMISAGSLWIIRYGYDRCFDWLFWVLAAGILSGLLGGISVGSVVSFGQHSLYEGLTDNPNTFGFIIAIATPSIFQKLYLNRKNRFKFTFFAILLMLEVHFLVVSYSRSAMAIFLCVLFSFCVSLSLSKKIQIVMLSFIAIAIIVVMMPVSYLESKIISHIYKSQGNVTVNSDASLILTTRSTVWQNSYEQAMKGGIFGGGFDVDIGNKHFSDEWICKDSHGRNIQTDCYGREKGNTQLAIMEETGIVGLVFYILILSSFFWSVVPYYIKLKGSEKVSMGLVLGVIIGLLMESIVEAWWDASAGQEIIYFWTLIGVAYGSVFLEKRRMLEKNRMAAV